MKYTIAVQARNRQVCKKYKKENALLKQELRDLKGTLLQVSHLFRHISKSRRQKRPLPSKRLNYNYRRHRTPRLSSSLVKRRSSNISLKSFISTDISSVRAINHSKMNSSFVVRNLSNGNEVCIDSQPLICGWISPNGSESGSSVYYTAKTSTPSSADAWEFYDAHDSYDADVEMSGVLMHGDKTVNESDIYDPIQSSPQLQQSQSVSKFTDFSFQSPHYVTQQTSDVFSNFDEILNNETNNNNPPHDICKCVFFTCTKCRIL